MRFNILLMVALFLTSCSVINPPKSKPVSGNTRLGTVSVSNYSSNQIQRLSIKSFNKKFTLYSPSIPENRKIEYWFYAQNADKIMISGYQNDVGRIYYDLMKLGVNCKKVCSVQYSHEPIEILFEKGDK